MQTNLLANDGPCVSKRKKRGPESSADESYVCLFIFFGKKHRLAAQLSGNLLFSIKMLRRGLQQGRFTEFDKTGLNVTKDQENKQLTEVGGRIRRVREERGLNLHELARLSGISAPALSLIETGKRDLRVTSLCRIAAALRVAAGDLLEDRPANSGAPQAHQRKGYDLGDYT